MRTKFVQNGTEVFRGWNRVGVRETPEWKTHAADLESEMLRCGMTFEVVDWA
jgi:hypothetical protein